VALCQALNSKGFNCFSFDFSGCGKSEGTFGDSSYTKQADDLGSVIDYFYERSYRIKSVIGHSMGGTVTILQAARDPRVEFIVIVSPRIFPLNHSIVKKSGKSIDELIKLAPITHSLFEDGTEWHYPISRRYLEDIKAIHVLDAIRRIEIPFLIVHGTEDKVVNIKESRRAFEMANEPKKLIEIKGADHAFSNSQDERKMIRSVLRGLKRGLKKWNIEPIPILVFLVFFVFISCLTLWLKDPLRLNYEQSWVVFALFSVLSLQYVEFSNRLKKLFRESGLQTQRKRKAERAAFYLQWTNLYFILTVAALGARIGGLSFYPEWQECIRGLSNDSPLRDVLLWSDRVTVASFIAGTFLRLVVFFDSYGRDLIEHPWQWPFVSRKD